MRLKGWLQAVEAGTFEHGWMPLTIERGGHVVEFQVSRRDATIAGVFESIDAHDMQQLGDRMGGWLLCTALIFEQRHAACEVQLLPITAPMVKLGGTVSNVTAAEHSAKLVFRLTEQGVRPEQSVAGGGKGWINDRGQYASIAINFGWLVREADTKIVAGDARAWAGVKVYPCWSLPGWWTVQPGGLIPDLARRWIDGLGLSFAEAKARGADIVYGDAHGLVGQDDYSQKCGPFLHPSCKVDGVVRPTAEVLVDPEFAPCCTHDRVALPSARLRGVPVWSPGPIVPIPDTDPAPHSSGVWSVTDDLADVRLGLRCLAWLGFELGIGVREIKGPKHNPRILSYSAHCRRGGVFLGVDAEGRIVWQGGKSTALPDDEAAWCAATQSEALRKCLLPGEKPPHGLRVAVWELYEDSVDAGTWRAVGTGYVPQPGDLAVLARAGGDPTKKGTGHVRCVLQVYAEELLYDGIGGNENDRLAQAPDALHRLDEPALRGFIVR